MKKTIPILLGMVAVVGTIRLFTQPVLAKSGAVTTWMGHVYAGDGLDANLAQLDTPQGFAADSACSLYVADTADNVIRKIDGRTNIISTYAGDSRYDRIDGSLLHSSFSAPEDIALGPNGAFYVADTGSNSIRILRGGKTTTWLKNLKTPTGLSFKGSTLYVSDTGNNRILRVTAPNGKPSTFVTLPTPGKSVISGGYLYVVHSAGTAFSKVNLKTKVITTIRTKLHDAEGLAVYQNKIYVTTGTNGTLNQVWVLQPNTKTMTRIANVPETEWYNHASDILFCGGKMRLLFSAGSSIFTLHPNASDPIKIAGVHRWGDQDGTRATAILGRPKYLVLAKDKKSLYLLENQKIKKIDLTTGILSFVAGHANDNYVDGIGDVARMSGATQMVLSPDGTTLYVADRNNDRIRVLNVKTAAMTTLTGAGPVNLFNDVRGSYAEGAACPTVKAKRAARCAFFDRPTGVAISPNGKTLYVADLNNNRIRTVNTKTGATAVFAGGVGGFKDGTGAKAQFRQPYHLLLSKDGKKLFVVELGNHAVRQIDLASKKVTTLFGTGKPGYRNGAFRDVVLSYPDSLAQGPGNTLFLSEIGSQRIRRINLDTQQVSFLAGSGKRGSLNGSVTTARFSNPRGMVLLNASTLLVADQMNDLLRSIHIQ